ncbi:MAG TPA: cupin domain-containing protein [Alphaproteobacteria bacterium]|nr:cupin domain-containing protein [Alphaproteobacteria bacterium]
MNEMLSKPRIGIDPYLDWVKGEGVPVVNDYAIYLFDVETAPWPRYGMKGAAVHCEGRGDFASMFLFELPPGGSSTLMRHLYEDVIYVLEGTGSTQVELADGTKRHFEWGPRSLFSIPINARHRHFNGSGQKRALFVTTTDMPLIMNIFHNDKFIFETPFEFAERVGKSEYYSGGGDMIMIRPGNHTWETNFVPDLEKMKLTEWDERGAGSSIILFVLADGNMHAHLSEMPTGTYKKGHRHGAGAHVMIVSGTGYSLFWWDDARDFKRLEWRHGMVFPPVERQWHQHFNTGTRPARYLATSMGSIRYPFTARKRRSTGTTSEGAEIAVATSAKKGGDQIEYEDQDSRIHPMFIEEMRRNGATPKMDKYFEDDGTPKVRAAR